MFVVCKYTFQVGSPGAYNVHGLHVMNPARGFIIGIARKFCKPLIERTKCQLHCTTLLAFKYAENLA